MKTNNPKVLRKPCMVWTLFSWTLFFLFFLLPLLTLLLPLLTLLLPLLLFLLFLFLLLLKLFCPNI
jgi:hypothetical protein